MAKISKELRLQIFHKSGGVCWYCGERLGKIFDVDHFIARHNGGLDNIENLVPSCKKCNTIKKHRTIEDFRNFYHNKKGMVFSKEQIKFLKSKGIEIPTADRHIFYFEKMELA